MPIEVAIGAAAARWAVGKALNLLTDGLLESWTASSKLGPNVRELKMELLYAQGMLNNARGWELRNRALEQLLLELRNVAYNADDVLDELEYFRIQDELEGTYETTDAKDKGCFSRCLLHTRHTTRSVTKCFSGLGSMCSCCGTRTDDDDDDDDDDDNHQETRKGCMDAVTKCVYARSSCCGGRTHDDDGHEAGQGCMSKVISSARNTTQAVGKRIPCPFLPRNWCSKAQQREHVVPEPKLKFDRVEISQRMKDIVEQLKPLCAKVATILELEIFGFKHSMAYNEAPDRPKSTHVIVQFRLYGREDLEKNLVNDITQGKYSNNKLTVFSIVAPGGMGKTTFTQHIYEKVSSHFHVPVWTCVSQNFNANRLAQEIKSKIPEGEKENKNASDEELIQIRLQSKRFLLVLDDMWTYHDEEWKRLLAPFQKVGTTGNVVIVTTRIPKVATMVATVGCFIRLERLKDEDCIPFFQECVFGDQQSREKHADLHSLEGEIVKKLKGFPLAVRTVGRLLRNKLTVEHWRRVLESKEWELHSSGDDIMPALKLSYNFLPFDLQQCFSHCALFPEDYEFDREELIRFWIGLGLLDNYDQNNRMEDIGSDYLDDLIDHGFFQKSENEDAQPNYVIHDLLHELAVSVSANECLIIRGSNVRSIQVPTSIRHLSISIDNTHVFKDRMTFENFKTDLRILGKKLKVENLRTLMLFGEHHGSFCKTFKYLFRKAKSLRVISLSGASYDVEDLFHHFSQLIHLRYLRIVNISGNKISLPSSIPKCYHLMVLDIEKCGCDSRSLGGEMRNLVKLRHFVSSNESFFSSIYEVGKLKSLQKLGCFEVKSDPNRNGFELKQLGQLRELKGSLRIKNLERVEDAKEAEEAKLVYMNHLHGLRLNWEANLSINSTKHEDILESLKPHSYLQKISIEGHRGTSCPSWLCEDLSVSNLEFLRLDDVDWKKFPPLGKLCTTNEHGEEYMSYITGPMFLNLKMIELDRLPRLKWWRGNVNSQLFSCLLELKVSRCSELLELPFSYCTCDQAKQSFPNLQKIEISDCPKLKSLPPIPWSIHLHKANISLVGTGIKELKYDNKRADLHIDMGNVDLDSELWNKLSFDNLGQIERLSIYNCSPMPVKHMQMLESLKTLRLAHCTNFLWPIEGDSHVQCQFLVDLEIVDCNASGKELTQLTCYFPKLKSLFLCDCKKITELGVAEKQTTAKQTRGKEIEVDGGQGLLLVPREMQTLMIRGCPNLRLRHGTLDDSTEAGEEGLQGLRSLTTLDIMSCPKFFASFAYPPFPASLQSLAISGCINLTISGSSAYFPFLASLQSLDIRGSTALTGEGFWELFAQGCLTELKVIKCPNFFTRTDTQTEPSRQDLPPFKLSTDDIAGVLTPGICARLSPFLTKLVFCYIRNTQHFTEAQESALQTLISLQELEIFQCSLQSLPASLNGLPNLKTFEIRYLDSIHSIPKDGLPSSLTKLRIDRCEAIRLIAKGSLPSSLQNLEIINCPAIQSLPKDVLPDSLRLLDVSGSNEELRRQCHKLKGTIPIVIVKAEHFF